MADSARLRALLEATRLIATSSSRDLDATLDALVDQTVRLLGADEVTIDLAAPGGELVRRRPSRLVPPDHPFAQVGGRFDPTGLAGEAVALGRPLATDDFQNDPRITAGARAVLASVRAGMAAPLVGATGVGDGEGEIVGLMLVHWTRPHRVSPADLETAEALAQHAAVAIRGARLLDEVRRGRDELQAVLEGIGDQVIVYDADGRVRAMNHAVATWLTERLGATPTTIDELRERLAHLRADASGAPQSPPPLAADAALRGEEATAEYLWPGPNERRYHVHATPVRDAEGRVRGAVSIGRDITELHQAIEERARLDGAVKTARLVAHALNNRLSFILGYGTLLPELVTGEPAAMARQMASAAEEAAALVHRLQGIVRFEEAPTPAGPMLDLEAASPPKDDPPSRSG